MSGAELTIADGRIRLHRGHAERVLLGLPTGSVDALITDSPYSSGGMVRGDRTQSSGSKYVGTGTQRELADFTGDTRDQRAHAMWCTLWLGEALRVVRPGGVAALFTDWRQLPTTTDALQAGGWIWRGIVPWSKGVGGLGARPQNGRFAAECEFIVWGSNGPMPVDYTAGAGVALRGFFSVPAPRHREHQAQKPVEIARELVKIVPPGGTVLDLFMGAGTIGVGAVLEGRRFIGAELVDEHFATAERRIRAALGEPVPDAEQDALDLTGGPS